MALAVLVIGPNEIPAMMRGLGRLMRRVQYIKYAVSQQFDDFMKDADMDDIGASVNFEESRNRDFDEASADEDVMEPLPQNDVSQEGEADDEQKPS